MHSTPTVADAERTRHARPAPARRALAVVAAIVLPMLWCASPGRGATGEKFGGWGSDGQVTARFAGGIALWEAPKRYVHLGFLPAAATPEERAGFLKLTWWPPSVKVPAMSVGLKFNDGEHTASLGSLHQYYVAFWNYPRNPYSTANSMNYISDRWDAFGGVQELSGDLRKGGRIRGRLAREWVFKKLDTGAEVRYRWELEFDAPLE